jgi:hypothetical protein
MSRYDPTGQLLHPQPPSTSMSNDSSASPPLPSLT